MYIPYEHIKRREHKDSTTEKDTEVFNQTGATTARKVNRFTNCTMAILYKCPRQKGKNANAQGPLENAESNAKNEKNLSLLRN